MPDQSSAASEHALMQEITAPLKTLPDDPLALVEADFPTSMRGYDRHAVDDYVEQVSRLVAELQATRSPEAAVRRALERVGEQISGILQRAHQTAEQITAQSRGEAEDRMEHARREGAAIIDAAEQKVRELDADADRVWAERARIIADAEELSAQLLTVAREAAERFPPAEEAPAEEIEPAAASEDVLADEEEGPIAPAQSARPAWDPTDDDPEDELESGGATDDEPDGDERDGDERDGDECDDDERDDDEEPADDEEHADDGPANHELDDDEPANHEPDDDEPDDDPGIDKTVAYRPGTEAGEPPRPRRLTDDDATRVIPPSSDAAQHRRDGPA
jgi:DivIVA domain-containing protein